MSLKLIFDKLLNKIRQSDKLVYDVTDYGAVGDGIRATDGAITAGTAILTSARGLFTAGLVGKTIIVNGAGAASNNLITTVASYQSATQITLTDNAQTSKTQVIVICGTDDGPALQALVNLLPNNGGVILFPQNCLCVTNNQILIKKHGVLLKGEAYSDVFVDQANMQSGINILNGIIAGPTMPAHTTVVQFGELGTNKLWTGGGVKQLQITGTKSITEPGNGISFLNMQHMRIDNCFILDVLKGIYVSSDQSGGISAIYVDKNLISSCTDIGIDMDSGSDENFVINNYVSGATQYGIRLNGIGNTAALNHVESTQLKGSGIADGTPIFAPGSGSRVYLNNIPGSRTYGIYACGSHSAIKLNTISNCNVNNLVTGAGIWIAGSPIDMSVVGNNINDNDGHMIYGIYNTADIVNSIHIEANDITGEVTRKVYSTNNSLKDIELFTNKVTIGGNKKCFLEVASAALSGATGVIAVNIPVGAKILGVQLRVDTLITSGDGGATWKADYSGGASPQVIGAGLAFTKNTKLNKMFDPTANTPLVTTSVGTITVTAEAGGKTFNAGVVRAIVYYEDFTAMGDNA